MIPTKDEVERAKREIAEEDVVRVSKYNTPEVFAVIEENNRRTRLPSEHPDHLHGLMCDGQDGMNSYCERLRRKLFGEDIDRTWRINK